jgi:hypothetical protein
MWDLWWSKWHGDRFSSEYFGFPLSISFYRCFITRENEKKIIFIKGLHNKPQGCGVSVASAAGHFTTKKRLKSDSDCQRVRVYLIRAKHNPPYTGAPANYGQMNFSPASGKFGTY